MLWYEYWERIENLFISADRKRRKKAKGDFEWGQNKLGHEIFDLDNNLGRGAWKVCVYSSILDDKIAV